jgi:hypothetical protein
VQLNAHRITCLFEACTMEFTAVVEHQFIHHPKRRPVILDLWNFFPQIELRPKAVFETGGDRPYAWGRGGVELYTSIRNTYTREPAFLTYLRKGDHQLLCLGVSYGPNDCGKCFETHEMQNKFGYSRFSEDCNYTMCTQVS